MVCNGDKMFYESFDDLTDDLKEKFQNNTGRQCSVTKSKNSYVKFINSLNENGHKLLTEYVHARETVLIDFNCGHEPHFITPNRYQRGNRCPYCYEETRGERRSQAKKGVNDIATTHPHLIQYFINIEDAHKHTYGSDKKVMMKCPHCGLEKEKKIADLTIKGFACDKCGDGISYPEKVVINVLEKLNVNFKFQFEFDDYKKQYKYDFHLIDLDTIIEVHGIQHYQDGKRGRSFEQEHENDIIKYDLAVLHGYEYNKNYFVIDARESNIEWLRNSIEQCDLFKKIDLSSVDWQEIDIQSQKSLKIEVCKYWNEKKKENSNFILSELISIFNVKRSTILNYLTWGNANGICTYDANHEKILNMERQKIYVYLLDTNKNKIFENKMCLKEMQEITGINSSTLKRCLEKQVCLSGGRGHCKYDSKYIGCSVILATDENSDSNVA